MSKKSSWIIVVNLYSTLLPLKSMFSICSAVDLHILPPPTHIHEVLPLNSLFWSLLQYTAMTHQIWMFLVNEYTLILHSNCLNNRLINWLSRTPGNEVHSEYRWNVIKFFIQILNILGGVHGSAIEIESL